MDQFNFRAVVLMFSCFGSLTELLSAVQSHLEQSYRHQQHNHLHDGEVGRESDGDKEIEDDLWDRQRWRRVRRGRDRLQCRKTEHGSACLFIHVSVCMCVCVCD